MPQLQIDGVVPIVPTPFSSSGAPDWSALKNLLDFAVEAGVCAVCLPAYASEFYKLTDAERRDAAIQAVSLSDGRIPVVAQVNHFSTAYVAETARELERTGAAAISVAVPRLFNLPERDLLRYFDRILKRLEIPLLIQDFNPGGATVSVEFLQQLRRQHEHFRYLKLEEPLMSDRVRAIIDGTSGELGVLEGWGGVYILELIPAGIVGVMPGLAVADILQLIWKLARRGDPDAAYSAFIGILPQITYSLQSLEFFHHTEKSLLTARGLLAAPLVREATLTVAPDDQAHIEFLNQKVLQWLDHLGLGRQPSSKGRETIGQT